MVDSSASIRVGHPVMFGLLGFFSFITAVISSTLTSDFNNKRNSPKSSITGSVRYLVFVGWLEFLGSIVYLALFLTQKGGAVTSIAGHGIFIFFVWLFQLAGAGAITAAMGGGNNCSHSSLVYCSSLEALMAFSWMSWILLTFMLVAVGLIGGSAFKGGRSVKEGLNEA